MLGIRLGGEHLATTVKPGRADVMTQMCLTCGGFNGNAGNNQRIVGTVHTALGRGFFILLDGHVPLLTVGCQGGSNRG